MGHEAKILIVDDEPCVRQLLVHILSQEGYDCTTAADGIEALQRLGQEPFSVIISDIRMPGLDGIGLLRQVKKTESFAEVIMATAVTDMDQALEAMRLGAYDYVIKPFNLSCTHWKRRINTPRVTHGVWPRWQTFWPVTFSVHPRKWTGSGWPESFTTSARLGSAKHV